MTINLFLLHNRVMESPSHLLVSDNSHARRFVEIQFDVFFRVCWKAHTCIFFTTVSVVDTLFVFSEAKHHC